MQSLVKPNAPPVPPQATSTGEAAALETPVEIEGNAHLGDWIAAEILFACIALIFVLHFLDLLRGIIGL